MSRKLYKHLLRGDILGVASRIKSEKKNPTNKYTRRRRRRRQ